MDYLLIMHITFVSIRQINVVMFQFKFIGSMNIHLVFIISFLLYGCPSTIKKLAPNFHKLELMGNENTKSIKKFMLNSYIIKYNILFIIQPFMMWKNIHENLFKHFIRTFDNCIKYTCDDYRNLNLFLVKFIICRRIVVTNDIHQFIINHAKGSHACITWS